MTRYVLANRRAGMFTEQAKVASRQSVTTALGMISAARLVGDHAGRDDLARRVVILDADADHIEDIRHKLPPTAILEPLVRRRLHTRWVLPQQFATALRTGSASAFQVRVAGAGQALSGIQVMFYVEDPAGQMINPPPQVETDSTGLAAYTAPPGYRVVGVEPLPYAACWIMLDLSPTSGMAINCAPIAPAGPGNGAWWHAAVNADLTDVTRGTGVKVGVIDTGCGPHPNLAHVNLVGAYVDGGFLPGAAATADSAQHGSHTSGIVGARPANPSDYAGIAVGCDLYHARVFKGEGPDDGPTQADLVNAIDSLSRDHGCDLINMSLGGGPASQVEQDAIQDALERGTLCVCSAGNDAGPVNYPGAYPQCASVSAIGKSGWAPTGTFSAGNEPHDPTQIGRNGYFLATFSSHGAGLACAGPGVGIVSTVPANAGFPDAYMEMDGTSMASPAAVGALAVILSKDAAYQALPRDASRSAAAKAALQAHCQDIGLDAQFQGAGLPVI